MEQGTGQAPDSDERLVSTLAEGEPDTLGILWDRHARLAYPLALGILRDPGWAEEIVQDVFVRLRKNPRVFDPSDGDLRRWLLTVTHHLAIDGLRGRRGTARTRDAGPDGLELIPRMDEDPADSIWRSVRADHVRKALSELPSAQRGVMELIYFRGLTQSETARHTGQPLGTVKSRLRLGLRKLRGSLAEIGATGPIPTRRGAL